MTTSERPPAVRYADPGAIGVVPDERLSIEPPPPPDPTFRPYPQDLPWFDVVPGVRLNTTWSSVLSAEEAELITAAEATLRYRMGKLLRRAKPSSWRGAR